MFKHFVAFLLLLSINSVAQIAPFTDVAKAKNGPSIVFALEADEHLTKLTEAITTAISKNLHKEGFEVVFIADKDQPSPYKISYNLDLNTKANVYLGVSQYGSISSRIWPYKSPVSNISPILERSYYRGINIAFKDMLDKNSLDSSINLATGIALYTVGDCDGMNTYFQPIFTSLKNSYKVDQKTLLKSLYFYQGNCLLLTNSFSEAEGYFENSLIFADENFPETSQLVGSAVNLAWTYVQLGKSQNAIDLMDRLVDEISQLGDGYSSEVMWNMRFIQRAEIYSLIGRYADAVKDLNFAIDLGSFGNLELAHIYLMRGQTYLLLYEWDNVLADYNKALELDPNYADAYYYRGVLKYSVLQTGQSLYTEALADFQKYLELSRNGNHAADAARYATDIQTQLTALSN